MTKTPQKRTLGGARRVPKQDKVEEEEEIIDQEATPTMKSVNKYEFNAPQFHDFEKQETAQNDSVWFGIGFLIPRAAARQPVWREALEFTGRRKKGITVPKPFNLAKAAHRTLMDSNTTDPKSPFVPLAVKIQTFEKKTPDRFKTRPVRSTRISQLKKLTQPQSPFLTTKLRSQHNQAAKVLTTAELEEQELKKVAPFKAKPVDKRILESKQELRRETLPLTIPHSPAIQKPKPKPAPKPVSRLAPKANPLPDLSKVFIPSVEHRTIAPADFTLPGDVIHEQKQKEIREKLEREKAELERLRAFKAKEPCLPEKPFTVKHSTKITEPEPFNLMTDVRGEIQQRAIREQLEKEQLAMEEAKKFHANPLPSLEPFIPARSAKPLTEIHTFSHHLETRMEERREYEEEQLRKQKEEEAARLEYEEMKRAKENKEIKQLRKEITHKAQPVRAYKGVEIKPSEKKLTEPQTPAFVRRSRVKK